MFIVIEGIDGAGKTKQAALLAAFVKKNGFKVLSVRDPGTTLLGSKIRDILKNSQIPRTWQSEILLFMAARTELADSIWKALGNGTVVICDRWQMSTFVYQGSFDKIARNFISRVTPNVVADLHPHTIYLDLDAVTAHKRRQARNNRADAFDVADEVWEERRCAYLQLAHNNCFGTSETTIVDANRSIEEVHKDIIRVLTLEAVQPFPEIARKRKAEILPNVC